MASTPDSIPVQTPKAWARLRYALGSHVPMRVGQIQASGRRIRAIGGRRPAPKKGG